MGCAACARRRKALEAKRLKKQQQGRKVQAAAIGAALAVTEAAGKAMGIHGEVEDGQQAHGPRLPAAGADDVGGSQGTEPDR